MTRIYTEFLFLSPKFCKCFACAVDGSTYTAVEGNRKARNVTALFGHDRNCGNATFSMHCKEPTEVAQVLMQP